MRTNTAQTPAEARENKKDGLRRYAPLLSGLALSGALLISPAFGRAEAEAGPAPKRECVASVKTGAVNALSAPAKDKTKGVELKVLLPARGKYLLVTLPPDYLADMGKAAEGKPEGQGEAFAKAVLLANIGLGYDKASGKTARFDCASLSEIAVTQDKPRKLIMDSGGEKPAPKVPPRKEQPKPDPPKIEETTPPAPAPTVPEQKRRGLKISDTRTETGAPEAAPAKAKTSTAAKPDAKESLGMPRDYYPLAAGGEGTESKPYTIRIPISSEGKVAGVSLFKDDLIYLIKGIGKIYLRLDFTAAAPTDSTVTAQVLTSSISMVAADIIKKPLDLLQRKIITPLVLRKHIAGAVLKSRGKVASISAYVRD